MKLSLVTTICLLLLVSIYANCQTKIGISRYDVNVEKYDLLEIEIELSTEYENPFDPLEVDVVGYFTSISSGTVFNLPGFYYEDIAKKNGISLNTPWPIELLTRIGTNNMVTSFYTKRSRQLGIFYHC